MTLKKDSTRKCEKRENFENYLWNRYNRSTKGKKKQ